METVAQMTKDEFKEMIAALIEQMENIKPEGWKGDRAGFYKLSEGDDRIINEILR